MSDQRRNIERGDPEVGWGLSSASGAVSDLLHHAVNIGMAFKQDPAIYARRRAPREIRDALLTELPEHESPPEAALEWFVDEVLPLCKNEASPRFLGFGDTGDDPAALAGGILSLLTQQNLINQSFDSPSATFVEIAVLRWLRELLGYDNPPTAEVDSVWDVGGVITHGGTMSNTTAMMLAREHHAPATMHAGVVDPQRFRVIVPRGIGHYSVKSALAWLGLGAAVIEVDTAGFRYNLDCLRRAVREHADRLMAVVAYAGDSRTQTVEHLRAVHDMVRDDAPGAWLHVDACWGLVCAFSDQLRHRIDGIELFDSVTVDPHKVMAVPYSTSALLVRQPRGLRSIASHSDLIMQEDYAFGQVTPFIGTKDWASLKLWMMLRSHGREGLARLVDRRVAQVRRFSRLVDQHPRLVRVHDAAISAVAFIYIPDSLQPVDGNLSETAITEVNSLNQQIHERMLAEGRWHLHQFSLPDDLGRLRAGATLYPLRFMANNPRTTDRHLAEVVTYVDRLGRDAEEALP